MRTVLNTAIGVPKSDLEPNQHENGVIGVKLYFSRPPVITSR